MPTCEWAIPFDLETSVGTLTLHSGTFPQYLIIQQNCKARRAVRATVDNIPQGDGDIFHDRWTAGYEMTIACQPWLSEHQHACVGESLNGTTLATMRDDLYEHLWALLRPDEDIQHRIVWTPTGLSSRMLDQIRLLDIADPQVDDLGVVTFQFTVDTVFPYAISELQTVTTIDGAGTLTNNGNVDFWPVMKINNDGGTILNNTTGLTIQINAGCLGGGSYIEVDTFRATAYVDGDGANAKRCIDVVATDFFPIVPGTNDIITNVPVDFLMNDAFA